MLKLVLASQSPRRRELLTSAGYEFTVSLVKVSEIFDENLNPTEVASHLATVKATACVRQHKELNSPEFLILAADTIVLLGEQILGKPKNPAQAREFLRLLSGKTHRVITGLALLWSGSGAKPWTVSDATEVSFRVLSDEEIAAYVATGEPMDKAGAYAIQGGARKFVSSFRGSWSNVVGLPLEQLEKALQENGWIVSRRTSEAT
jgi:septum formation protein